jgi:hypothetical protein
MGAVAVGIPNGGQKLPPQGVTSGPEAGASRTWCGCARMSQAEDRLLNKGKRITEDNSTAFNPFESVEGRRLIHIKNSLCL